jgi:2-polyprenyl-3-methyl-5-hydroxy-6-metoxy-1,4-benzoquinol methylase
MRLQTQDGVVHVTTPGGEAIFEDTPGHLVNAVMRLLRLSETEFMEWLRIADEFDGNKLETLGPALHEVKKSVPWFRTTDARPSSGPGRTAGVLLHESIALAPEWGIAVDANDSIAWLVRPDGSREEAPAEHEAVYYEGGERGGGSYGNYAAERRWRMEKAHNLLSAIRQRYDHLGPGARLLDVGSGYGFFRHAATVSGLEHEGVDVSLHASNHALEEFGFATHAGIVADYREQFAGRFDLVTLWDVIEHVADPAEMLRDIAACLTPAGVVAIRTPNLDCPEAEIFGPYYHSYQRPHLVCFTPGSLGELATRAGLRLDEVVTTSHLLQGFFGKEQIDQWSQTGRGSDFVAYLRRADTQ